MLWRLGYKNQLTPACGKHKPVFRKTKIFPSLLEQIDDVDDENVIAKCQILEFNFHAIKLLEDVIT